MPKKKTLKRLIESKFVVKGETIKPPKQEYAVLSAERSNLTHADNDMRTHKLAKQIKEQGLNPIPAKGVFQEEIAKAPSEESSFVVPGLRLPEAEHLGKEFNQDSVLENNVLENLKGQSPKEEVFIGKTKFGKMALKEKYRTKVKARRGELVYSLQKPEPAPKPIERHGEELI